ncbi:hypothetical protein QWJ07_34340 [Frankia sp. RB7]|nr:hypothetical protein [Frankia sp. RB7]
MAARYASDDIVRNIFNAGRVLSKAQYIYTEEEAKEPFFAVLHEIDWIVEAIPTILSIKADVYFAVVISQTPYQVTHLGDGTFVVLVDQRAFYMLLTLCLRIQTLSPFCDHFGFSGVSCDKDYAGKFLLDIAKDFVFHTSNVAPFLKPEQSRLIYQAASTYIIGHEIAHVAHGHLDFKASSEFPLFATSNDDRNLTLRTLEMDADSSATTSVFDVFERYLNRVLQSAQLPLEKSPDEIRLSVREQYVAGMFIALLYMDALSDNFAPAAYPISYARFLTTFDVVRTVLTRVQADYIPERMRQLLVAVFERLSGGIGTLGHPIASNVMVIDGDLERPSYEYNDLGIAAGLEHLQPLHNRWALIRPFLERYQRGGRLAPARAVPI